MSKVMLLIIMIVVLINVGFLIFYLNMPAEEVSQTSTETPEESQETQQERIPEETPQETLQETEEESPENETNLSLFYKSLCVISTKNYAKNIVNITNITENESRIFDKDADLTYYLTHNWSSVFYEIEGIKKDITDKNVVSIFDIKAVGNREFTLPILCDENGNIGNYSSCLLDNVPNVPLGCYNFTINLTECQIEWAEHYILDDIQYWVEPEGGAIVIGSVGIENKSVLFNFTISSSHNRLEYYGMNIIQRIFTPRIIDDQIFSSIKLSSNGKGGTITRSVNVTDKKNIEYYATVWFKKKCYDKYVIY